MRPNSLAVNPVSGEQRALTSSAMRRYLPEVQRVRDACFQTSSVTLGVRQCERFRASRPGETKGRSGKTCPLGLRAARYWTISVAEPVTIPDLALIVAVPAFRPVARPVRLTDATILADVDQLAVLVMSLEEPSL